MANPKRKISRSKRDKRRANWMNSLDSGLLVPCENCGEKKIAHHVCPECGYYRGRSVTNPQTS